MKGVLRHKALFVLGILVIASSAFAQTADEALERALAAAPRQMKEGATVIKWKADNTYNTLRKGTNRLVCYDRSGDPGQQPFAVQCTSVANLDRVAQNRKFEAIADQRARQAALDAAEKDGTRVKPEFGSVWLTMSGPDWEHARIHTTVAVPGATARSLGFPDIPRQDGVWIMNVGTSSAHLMWPEVTVTSAPTASSAQTVSSAPSARLGPASPPSTSRSPSAGPSQSSSPQGTDKDRGPSATLAESRRPDQPLPILGTCNQLPNYAAVGFERWAGAPTGLTVTVSISVDSGLSGVLPVAAERYRTGATFGSTAWEAAIANLLGRPFLKIQLTNGRTDASIQVDMSDQPSKVGGEGNTVLTYGTVLGRRVITGARISIYRPGVLRRAEELLATGQWSELQFESLVAKTVAHEMGHALGLVSHSPGTDNLMSVGGNGVDGEALTNYRMWITQSDANTLAHAYCGATSPAVSTSTGAASASGPRAGGGDTPVAQFSPFVGRWSCRTGSMRVDYFNVRPDGTISFPATPRESKLIVSGSQIRFEQVDDDTTFYEKRTFAFTYSGGQLRGTRTQTSRLFPPVVDQYVCTKN